jgi:hypothetical protein
MVRVPVGDYVFEVEGIEIEGVTASGWIARICGKTRYKIDN